MISIENIVHNQVNQIIKTSPCFFLSLKIIILTEMQFSYEHLQTLRKPKKLSHIGRTKSLQQLYHQQLTPKEVKLLLAVPKQPSLKDLQHVVQKQQLLFNKKLFNPFKYFGCPSMVTYEQSFRHHYRNLQDMFGPTEVLTQRKVVKKFPQEINTIKIEDASPIPRSKNSVFSNQKTRRTVNRSPKSYVKENKQNFQRMNINNMQKVRVKLKLNKK